jgi:hypothetical protein
MEARGRLKAQLAPRPVFRRASRSTALSASKYLPVGSVLKSQDRVDREGYLMRPNQTTLGQIEARESPNARACQKGDAQELRRDRPS